MKLRDFYGLRRIHQVTKTHFGQILLNEYKVTYSRSNVSSTMYSFMKRAGFTHLNLKEITDCKIRKFAKIIYGWKTFAQSQNLEAETQIIFKFPDTTSNLVLFWICL
ncbi:hypothetical protein HKD37_17G048955 [Glycine soja]